eukprot:scaffold208500_cov40-Tisochrysis_lutea.AAC.2
MAPRHHSDRKRRRHDWSRTSATNGKVIGHATTRSSRMLHTFHSFCPLVHGLPYERSALGVALLTERPKPMHSARSKR